MFNPLKIITKPIGCLCTLVGSFILFFVVLGLVGLWSFNTMAPKAIESLVETRGGFPVTVDDAGWDLLDSSFVVQDIVVVNPPNFPEPDFLHVRKMSIKGDIKGLVLQEEAVVLEQCGLNIERINWVITEGGSSNVGLFAQSIDGNEPRPSGNSTPAGLLQANSWVINIGTVEVNNYSRGSVQREKYVLNYQREFHGGESVDQVAQIVAHEFASQGLEPMLRELITSLFSLPDIRALAEDVTATGWLLDRLKEDNP